VWLEKFRELKLFKQRRGHCNDFRLTSALEQNNSNHPIINSRINYYYLTSLWIIIPLHFLASELPVNLQPLQYEPKEPLAKLICKDGTTKHFKILCWICQTTIWVLLHALFQEFLSGTPNFVERWFHHLVAEKSGVLVRHLALIPDVVDGKCPKFR